MRDSVYKRKSAIGRAPPEKKESKTNVGGALGGAASGALGGAEIGSAILPGYGTAAGAVIGGVLGGYAGSQSPADVGEVVDAKKSYDKSKVRQLAAAKKKAKEAKDASGFLKTGEKILKAT
jgi:uncharacterized protein YcfJ